MAQPTTIKSGDPRNDVTPNAPRGFSKFDLSHRFLQTHRFGEITPHESFETVKGAKDSLRLMCDTSSYSLKAPLKTEMFQKRCNFFVPLQAILPNSWELITSQPVSGDDVPEDCDGVVDAPVINSFFDDLVIELNSVRGEFLSESLESNIIRLWLTKTFRNFIIAEMFFSQGSLLKQLYFDFSHCVMGEDFGTPVGTTNTRLVSFDRFLEQVLSSLAPKSGEHSGIRSFVVRYYDNEDLQNPTVYRVVADDVLVENPLYDSSDIQMISYRHFLDLCRQNLNFEISYVEHGSSISIDASWNIDENYGTYSLSEATIEYIFGNYVDPATQEPTLRFVTPLTENLNFNKVSAYQISCAHFFSLDHVDYIYSAELYRQLMKYYFMSYVSDGGRFFDWNGIRLEYDALSGLAIRAMAFNFYALTSSTFDENDLFFRPHWNYMTALFSFRHSLRYLDYFTGGRTQPLSVGSSTDPRANVNVVVNDGAVNGVEMILAQNAARYLNFAQRAGRKISQWLDKMFPGGVPKPDYHDPQWLSATGDALNPEQTQNTGAAQVAEANSITARFKNDSNNYMFTVHPDRPGYIICVTYYDIPRAYAFATHRENMHCNRYDRFNPFMQYNGSQAVHKQEIGLGGNTPFSYQGRYEEYKQNYDIVAGGFVENLPGFAFIADLQSGLPMQRNLNPTYIRSWNCELDPFYLALTGYGLAGYFHFIVKNVNIINSVRPMEYAPQLM